ncbi:MAG: response regulator transcription factor [bacterium]|nr:response regulator transcription factor [bacterium]
MMAKLLRVLIADDHEIVREGLVQILTKNGGITVVGQAKNGLEAVKKCEALSPDIIIMDVGMPILNGIEAAAQITAKKPDIRIIILSMHADDTTVMRALKSGVSGFVLKTGDSKELLEAIRTAGKRQSYLSPEVSATVLKSIQSPNTRKNRTLELLTKKEKHVLQLIAEGNSTKEIASMLQVSFHTVKTHRNHIMEKLAMHSVAELTRYAVDNKIIM